MATRRTDMFPKCYFANNNDGPFYIFVFLISLFLPGTYCVIPQASQEGLLHSFKSYSDVTLFHFNVPKEVLRATWQFAAFMDEKSCPERTVHIYLKWGSYPIISVNNATFPTNMYSQDNDTVVVSIITSFEPKTVAVVPIYGPKPGDWFVGAYLSHWDEKVQQEGLGHKCHYSIGSIALWMQANIIESIPIGYQKTLRTRDTMSYYKIYIPSGTWDFRLHIWACNFTIHTLHEAHETCIKSLALQARVLPIFNPNHPSKVENLTTSDFYTFEEYSPHEDSYYYLLVISDSVIEFNVKVSTSECPIKQTEKPFIGQYLVTSTISKPLQGAKDFKTHRSRDILNNSNSLSYSIVDLHRDQFYPLDENVDLDNKCFPRYQLVRVKHSQTFSGVYLLQGREWLTSWIVLTDSFPIITQFNILPLIDIGGTLDINIHLEMDKLLTKQLVSVTVCIQRDHTPSRIQGRIICSNDKLSMNLSSLDQRDANLLIPYPQPGTWYISFYTKCYKNGYPVRCEMEQVLVSLNVHTRQCVFSGNHSCGHHGVCQEIHKDLLFYTACSCFDGYKGWGCTDGISANPETSFIRTTLMLTLSNGFFIPAIYLAIKRRLYTEGLVYFATMISSSLYHACDQHVTNYCVTKYEVLQYSDFFSSILAFWVTLIAKAELPIQYVSLFHMLGVLIIAFGVQSGRTSLNSILLPLVIGVMIPIATYIYRSYLFKKWRKPDKMLQLVSGLLLAGIGIFLFSLVETEANYQYVHSAWHVIIAISLLFLLPVARLQQFKTSNTDSSSGNSELLSYTDSSSSAVLKVTTEQENLIIYKDECLCNQY